MREFCTKWWKRIATVDMLFIGVLTLLASLFASWLKQFPGFSLFGALIIALLIGMIIQFPIRSAYVGSNDGRKAGVKDAAGLISNKLLRLGIILLGFKLNLAVLFTQGIKCLPIAAVVVTLTIIVCYAIARKLGKRARVMLRVTVGVHAGGHEYISTAHEDQKFGVPLLAAGADAAVLDVLNDLKDVTPAATNARISATHSPENGAEKTEKSERELHYDVKYPYDLSHEEVSDTDKALAAAMEAIADGPSIAVLKTILANQDVLELVGAHSHIGSNIHDADAFIHAAKRMMLLRKTLWATDAYILPEIDLGGGYSVAYTDGEDSMDIDVELTRLADAVNSTNRALGMPAPAISFEPGRYIVAPAGVTLYRVGTIKHVHLSDAKDSDGNPIAERVYVSVDGGMSDNIRPALYGADYTARLANRTGSAETMLARVCGMHCESGDIVVHEVQLPADLKRGDILAVPVTGAYGRTMASNYNQALIPAVVAGSEPARTSCSAARP